MKRIWILGASDPEMATIEQLLRDHDEVIAFATGPNGDRVHPGNAYQSEWMSGDTSGRVGTVVLVECDGKPLRDFAKDEGAEIVRVDHHRPSDFGYGKPPAEFMEASSLGQVLTLLGFAEDDWLPAHFPFVAAADHCLAAAYRGECPNVIPDELMAWRIKTRSAFQGRSAEAILADVEAARQILRDAVVNPLPATLYGYDEDGNCYPSVFRKLFADLRGRNIPELPEAAAREGIPFLATAKDQDGREKVVLQAAPAELVQQFLSGGLVPGLVDTYGDPARGFAGGYIGD